MKNVRHLIACCLVGTVLGIVACKKKEVTVQEPVDQVEDPGSVGTLVDSTQVIALLTAKGRYWCLEKITRTVGDKTEDVSEDTTLFTRIQVWYAHANAYQFLDGSGGRTLFESPQESVIIKSSTYNYSDGVSGNRPYGTAELLIREGFIYFGPFHGKWNWDAEKQTVSVQLPTEPDLLWKAAKGYLDRDMLPKYKSLAEAQDAAKPERIRIVMEEKEEAQGKVTYAYTLRAAWIIRREASPRRELSKYIVFY
ncbi:hypothetical protein GCM10027275_38610 [Rhabdobacter roseus]|uniref:Lipoprotein n=1 Tax=Rhabdobacter roseus TaxID=1655419 RepID=A0A840TWC5_9BACT|nr:hypothetical protein [Rhabdobacter roseus]MBB5285563.1 hypothetical protein [Rhabdobacter roseus]